MKTYRVSWLDNEGKISSLKTATTDNPKHLLADAYASMLCTASLYFGGLWLTDAGYMDVEKSDMVREGRVKTIVDKTILKSIKEGPVSKRLGIESYYLEVEGQLGTQVLFCTEIK